MAKPEVKKQRRREFRTMAGFVVENVSVEFAGVTADKSERIVIRVHTPSHRKPNPLDIILDYDGWATVYDGDRQVYSSRPKPRKKVAKTKEA